MINAFAPAKLNLTLLVGGPIKEGEFKNYHPLNSLVVFADTIGDMIEIKPNEGFEFSIKGRFANNLENNQNNLIVRAANLMAQSFDKHLDLSITLFKELPIAAGLGGGSADAAAIICGLNDYWSLGLSKIELCEIGIRLGADIPVCIMGETVIMKSIGQVFEPAPKIPQNIAILIANPLCDCPTPEVFKKFDEIGNFSDIDSPQYKDYNSLDDLVAMLETMPNSLYRAANMIAPQISILKTAIESKIGTRFVAMSGSGASVFGIFDTFENAQIAASELTHEHKIWAKAGMLNNAK